MKLSIITVTYNNALGLERTIKSIANQTCKDFEYIIVDGASTDNSLDIIKQNTLYISKWVTEPDTGIYNAMNKAVRMATGDYCLFMNAGDELYSNTTIEEIYNHNLSEDFIEGREYDLYIKHYSYPPKKPTLAFYLFGGNNRHQSSLIKTKMLLENPYDEKLRISSDLKFNMQSIIVQNCSYICIDVVIAKYEGKGISRNINHSNERESIFNELFPYRVIIDYKRLSFYYNIYFKFNTLLTKLVTKIKKIP